MFTKALKHKVAGNSMVQVSKSGYNVIKKVVILKNVKLPDGSVIQEFPTWKVVPYTEYLEDKNKVERTF